MSEKPANVAVDDFSQRAENGSSSIQNFAVSKPDPSHWQTGVTILAIAVLIFVAYRNGDLSSQLNASKAANNDMVEWCELVYAHLVKTEQAVPHCPKPR